MCKKILNYASYVITSITEAIFCGKSELRQLRNYINYEGKYFWKKPELRQLRYGLRRQFFFKKNLNYVNYVITPITQLQKRQNHPFVLPLVWGNLLNSFSLLFSFFSVLHSF